MRTFSFAALAAIAFLVVGADDSDARCGQRQGLVSRIAHPFRTISANHQARIESRAAARQMNAVPAPPVIRVPMPLPVGPVAPQTEVDPFAPKNAAPKAAPVAGKIAFKTTFLPHGVSPPATEAGWEPWKQIGCNKKGCNWKAVPLATPPQPKTVEQFDVSACGGCDCGCSVGLTCACSSRR